VKNGRLQTTDAVRGKTNSIGRSGQETVRSTAVGITFLLVKSAALLSRNSKGSLHPTWLSLNALVRLKEGGRAMDRFYFISENPRSGKPKFLTVLSGKKVALSHLKDYAAETANETYVLDVLSKTVIASMNR
jgi:hypothetical protein